ncbi:MAG TPA: hypothetical protein VFD82_20645, partial [Planctomycetota bacterium]|nr:hypothetical protein [Planctomycetota bacterium]
AAGAVLATAAILWWSWPPADVAPRTHDAVATASPAPAALAARRTDTPAQDPVAPVATLRSAAEPAQTAPETKEPAAAGPMDVAILVVDNKGEAVRDATVSVFEHAFRIEPDGSKKPTDDRADGPPRGSWRTDDLGRTRVTFADGCLVSASKQGVGWSGDMELKPSEWRVPDELRLVLLPLASVRGRVLAADGLPVAGALVDGHQQYGWLGLRHERFTGNTPRVTADGEGRFAVEVRSGEDVSLTAQHGGKFVRQYVRALQPGAETDVTLRFPGAFGVRGVLLGEDGRPLAGSVRLLGVGKPEPRVHLQGKSDAEGRFEFLLAEAGTFVLVGGVAGQTSARADIVLEAARPHAEVTLRTTPFADVDGKVVDEHGEPIAGAWVALGYVVERDAVHEQRSDLHGILPRGPADAEGLFRFRAPAGYRYRVVARALPDSTDLWVKGPEFAIPASDLVVVIREADRQGFVVTGRIVAASDGSPLRGVTIERVETSEHGASSGNEGKSDDGTFRIGPFATGKRYSFAFGAEGFARTVIGPFDATVRTEEVVVRLPRCGTVRCRVLRADGTPAASAFVSLAAEPRVDFGRAWQGEADQDGCIEFTDVVPGAYKVYARATARVAAGAVGDTVVRPQQTSTVKIVLQN